MIILLIILLIVCAAVAIDIWIDTTDNHIIIWYQTGKKRKFIKLK